MESEWERESERERERMGERENWRERVSDGLRACVFVHSFVRTFVCAHAFRVRPCVCGYVRACAYMCVRAYRSRSELNFWSNNGCLVLPSAQSTPLLVKQGVFGAAQCPVNSPSGQTRGVWCCPMPSQLTFWSNKGCLVLPSAQWMERVDLAGDTLRLLGVGVGAGLLG